MTEDDSENADREATKKVEVSIDLEKPSSDSLDKPPEELTEDEFEELGIEIDTEELPDELLEMSPEEFFKDNELTFNFRCEHEWDDPPDNRPRGFLTEADRQFLRGESEIESQSHSERKARERIRNRIFHAFIDFSLVAQFLEDRDRKQIFSNPNRSSGKELALWNGAIHTLAFIYERLKDEENYDFKYSLNAAILAVEQRPGTIAFEPLDITFEVDTSGVVDLGTIGEKLRSGRLDALSAKELDAVEFALKRDVKREDGISMHAEERSLNTLEWIREEFVDSDEGSD